MEKTCGLVGLILVNTGKYWLVGLMMRSLWVFSKNRGRGTPKMDGVLIMENPIF